MNQLAHDMDPVRLTTLAQFFACPTDGSPNQVMEKYRGIVDTILLTRIEQGSPVYYFAGMDGGDTVADGSEDADLESVPELQEISKEESQ
ncbi:MAG: hypothetical protein LIO86_05210 [Lachnospiraceae bacterium]|nr:hypothetical protein [Lachnospiraceae bacterium]